MEEIKVGEYIRTYDGCIGKIIENRTLTEKKFITDSLPFVILQLNRDFRKHSSNIIDLIEAGDYVNGCKVYENRETYLMVYQKVRDSEVDYNYINYDEIKSIVTKEMMKSVEYKVGE